MDQQATGEGEGAPPAPAPAALDIDGIVVVSLGTVVWAVLLVLTLVFEATLRRHGHLWWIAATACGFGLGVLGVGYCLRRRSRLGAVADRAPEV